MAKHYLTHKQFLKKSLEVRQDCYKFWSSDRIQNLIVNLLTEMEEELRIRTDVNKQNIITNIDFSGAYIYIGFCNTQTVGPMYLRETKILLDELNIPYENSMNNQCTLFIELDTFLYNIKLDSVK